MEGELDGTLGPLGVPLWGVLSEFLFRQLQGGRERRRPVAAGEVEGELTGTLGPLGVPFLGVLKAPPLVRPQVWGGGVGGGGGPGSSGFFEEG